jgi:prepilin-type N-terminal cleavage/methylation domain-containing protein
MNPSNHGRQGFTLIEVLISVVILSLVAAGLAGGMLSTSRQGRVAKITSARNTVMQAEVSRISATPIAEIAAGTNSATVVRDGVSFTRTTTITATADSFRTRVIVAPPAGRGVAPDTIILTRTRRAAAGNPFSP